MSYRNSLEFNTRVDLQIAPNDAHAIGTVTGQPTSRQGLGDLTVHTNVDHGGAGTATVQVKTAPRKADGSAPDPGDFAIATDRDGNDIEVVYDSGDDGTIGKFRVVGDRLDEYYRVDVVVATATMGLAVQAISEYVKYDSQSDHPVSVFK